MAGETIPELDFNDVLAMMHGHWECFDSIVRGEEALHALELALREPPRPALVSVPSAARGRPRPRAR
jgi:hypothetical protein